jgi:hypothetical protein
MRCRSCEDGKLELPDRGVPKLELGNEGGGELGNQMKAETLGLDELQRPLDFC